MKTAWAAATHLERLSVRSSRQAFAGQTADSRRELPIVLVGRSRPGVFSSAAGERSVTTGKKTIAHQAKRCDKEIVITSDEDVCLEEGDRLALIV